MGGKHTGLYEKFVPCLPADNFNEGKETCEMGHAEKTPVAGSLHHGSDEAPTLITEYGNNVF